MSATNSESTIQDSNIDENLPSVSKNQPFSDLHTAIDAVKMESDKYGNKPSKIQATRLRKSLMELAKKCKDQRKCVLSEVKKIKPVPRLKKTVTEPDEQRENEEAENVLVKKVAKRGKKEKKDKKEKNEKKK